MLVKVKGVHKYGFNKNIDALVSKIVIYSTMNYTERIRL